MTASKKLGYGLIDGCWFFTIFWRLIKINVCAIRVLEKLGQKGEKTPFRICAGCIEMNQTQWRGIDTGCPIGTKWGKKYFFDYCKSSSVPTVLVWARGLLKNDSSILENVNFHIFFLSYLRNVRIMWLNAIDCIIICFKYYLVVWCNRR